METNTLSLPGWEPTIGMIRMIGLFGLALSASGLTVTGFRMFATAKQSQEALIRLRYGTLLVNVYERNLAAATTFIDVTKIDELAKLAERHNTVILHMTINSLHCYLVQYNGITYRYAFSAGRRGTAEMKPSQQILNYVTDMNQNKVVEMELNEDELFGYVIDKNKPARTDITDSVILKKIKI